MESPVVKYIPLIQKIVNKMIWIKNLREDAVNDICIKFEDFYFKYDSEQGDLDDYLRWNIRYKVLDFLRKVIKSKRDSGYESGNVPIDKLNDGQDPKDNNSDTLSVARKDKEQLISKEMSPEHAALYKDFWDYYNIFLEELNGLPKLVWILRHHDGFTQDEVKDILDISIMKVWRMERIVKTILRKKLKSKGFEESDGLPKV